METSNNVTKFVNYVIELACIDSSFVNILDMDLDRIYLSVNSTKNNYTIRTWDITDNGIRFTLFKYEESAKEIVSGYYKFEQWKQDFNRR